MNTPIREKLDYVPGQDGMQPGDTAQGRAVQLLSFRAGDGPLIEIQPDCTLRLERAPQSMEVSWLEGGQPMNAAIPVVEFNALIASQQLVIER